MNEAAQFAELALVRATPLVFAALAGVLCERAGILNIALEGTLAFAAFCAVIASFATGSPLVGLLAGVVAGALVCGTLGVAATKFRADQIVAGTALNVVAIAGAAFGVAAIFGAEGATPAVPSLGPVGERVLTACALVATVALFATFSTTPWGLRVRAAGENPRALAAAGIDPLRVRLIATLVAGAIAGLGGVFLSLGELSLYSDGMSAGRGFIALAAVIFGRWNPLGAAAAALGFGALSALQFFLQRTGVPSEAMQALPYLAALLALAGVAGRARPPASDGVPYP